MPRSDELYLTDIVDRIARIREYTKGVEFADFQGGGLLQDAVLRNLELIGEAARQLTRDTRDGMSDVPWREIIAMRNILIHAYMDVDLVVAWQTIQLELDPLEEAILRYLEQK